jgi:hypothetical protein
VCVHGYGKWEYYRHLHPPQKSEDTPQEGADGNDQGSYGGILQVEEVIQRLYDSLVEETMRIG